MISFGGPILSGLEAFLNTYDPHTKKWYGENSDIIVSISHSSVTFFFLHPSHLKEHHELSYEKWMLVASRDQELVAHYFEKSTTKNSPWGEYFSVLDTSNKEAIACNLCLKVFKCKGPQSQEQLRHLKLEHFEVYSQVLLVSRNKGSGCDTLRRTPPPDEEGPLNICKFFQRKSEDPWTHECLSCSKVIHSKGNDESLDDLTDHLQRDHSSLYVAYMKSSLAPKLKTEPEEEEERASTSLDDGGLLGEVKDGLESNVGTYRCKLCPQELKGSHGLLSLHLRIVHPEVQEGFKSGNDHCVEGGDEYFKPALYGVQECRACGRGFEEGNVEAQEDHLRTEHKDIYSDLIHTREEDDEMEEEDNEEEEQTESDLPEDSIKSKKRSLVWNYFKTTEVPFINACKFCAKVFKCKGQTTSSMIRHLRIEHIEVFEEFSSSSSPSSSLNGRKASGESSLKYFTPVDSEDEEEEDLLSSMDVESSHNTEIIINNPSLGEDSPAIGGPKISGNKRRSSIWNYFVSTEEHEMNACRVCNRIFKCKGQTTSSMIRHLKKEHVELFNEFLCNKDKPRDPLEVSMSIKKEKKRSPIWNYFEKTDTPGTNECITCKKEFKCKGQSTFNMIRHLETMHPSIYQSFLSQGGRAGGEERQICAECGKQFTNRSALTQHMKVSHASSCPYKCEICNATFTRRESYEQHSHDKNKPRNFLCTICGKTFARRSIRDFHEKAHDAEKKYECAYCPKKFLTNQRKYKHERTHTGEKPYQCTDCGRQFTLSHHLVTHSRIHTGQKPYSCDFCPQTFRHLSSRNNHKCEGKLRLNSQS